MNARGLQPDLDPAPRLGRGCRRRVQAAHVGPRIALQLGQVAQLFGRVAGAGFEAQQQHQGGDGALAVTGRSHARAKLAVKRDLLDRPGEIQRDLQRGDDRFGLARRLEARAQQLQRLPAHLGRGLFQAQDPVSQRQRPLVVAVAQHRRQLGQRAGRVGQLLQAQSRDPLAQPPGLRRRDHRDAPLPQLRQICQRPCRSSRRSSCPTRLVSLGVSRDSSRR